MKLRIGGPLPFRFEMNGLMVAGSAVFFLGAAGWAAGAAGAWPEGSLPEQVSMGTCIGGIALYFLGRVVQFVGMVRNR